MTVAAYRDRATGRYPITLDDLRRSAGMLFGDEPTSDVLEFVGVDPVTTTAPPTYDPATQTLAEGAPGSDGGSWFQTWVVAALPPPPVPIEVTRRQAKIVLSRAGLLAQADQIIAAMPGQAGEEARIDWTDAAVFRRDNPLILGIGETVGLTDAQIDDLFRQAAQIV